MTTCTPSSQLIMAYLAYASDQKTSSYGLYTRGITDKEVEEFVYSFSTQEKSTYNRKKVTEIYTWMRVTGVLEKFLEIPTPTPDDLMDMNTTSQEDFMGEMEVFIVLEILTSFRIELGQSPAYLSNRERLEKYLKRVQSIKYLRTFVDCNIDQDDLKFGNFGGVLDKLEETIIEFIGLYGSETWVPRESAVDRLNRYTQ